MKVYDKIYIGGEWVAPATDATIEVIGAATEQVIGRVPDGSPADMDRAVAAARHAFDKTDWPWRPAAERGKYVRALADAIAARSDELAKTIAMENGAPISTTAYLQVGPPARSLKGTADYAEQFQFEQPRGGGIVRYEPVGVVGAIVPWNVPQTIIANKIGPALMAGCTVVLKPSPEAALDAYILAEAAMEAGFPPGVLSIVVAGREAGEHLVTHPGVDKITFTGSVAAGKRVASLCGERIRRVTLELGGKSAAVILADADLDAAMDILIPGTALMNNGQACVAQTRILAPRARYTDVVDALRGRVEKLVVGDPLDPATQIGPMVTERQRGRVLDYIRIGREEGAKVVTGGGRPASEERGWFVEPTVFADVDNRMRIAQEEIFGPVLAVIPFEDEQDAVRIANDSLFGLSGGVYTADGDRGLDIARQIRTGVISVNGGSGGGPFGGFKESGIGREGGPEGFAAFLEIKAMGPSGSNWGAPVAIA